MEVITAFTVLLPKAIVVVLATRPLAVALMLPILTLLEAKSDDQVKVELPNEKVAFVAGILLPLALTAFTVVRVPLTTRLPETYRYELALIYTLALNMVLAAVVMLLTLIPFALIEFEVRVIETTLEVVVVAYTFTVTTLAVVDKVPVTATLPWTLAVPATVRVVSGESVFTPTRPLLANRRLVFTVRPFLTLKELLLTAISVPFPQSTLSIIYNSTIT